MSMHKGILGQQFGGASTPKTGSGVDTPTTTPGFDRYPYMKHSTADETEQTLAQYIQRKLRNDAFNTVNAKDYSSDFAWVADFIDNKNGVLPLTAHYIDDYLHIQGHGSALVLLPSGKWFMTDTSGG